MYNSRPIYLNEDTRILWVRACVFSKQYKTVHNYYTTVCIRKTMITDRQTWSVKQSLLNYSDTYYYDLRSYYIRHGHWSAYLQYYIIK